MIVGDADARIHHRLVVPGHLEIMAHELALAAAHSPSWFARNRIPSQKGRAVTATIPFQQHIAGNGSPALIRLRE
eukprot:CAMPEP_0182885768 /NCGR_PEP_ID=MMETSP0034_2-20130328/19810_1 /TAXON_ID=156128 /ORGANISM="Nephroselmis pyriformis, Strain CCMP717" /LENGTH=74 /DNA_ID=CAMNT_0025019051 /DNA_START=308 /DNA_END=533 /DNA_ORIENTATION=+